ncbi:uncharacterized protein LOC142174617 [Nicotiana tabacum]|uniref:Uncharacterized protein LOC142174617 n=1 Tax=Nicotiana tabacum TaxID=4097 RepID=A0AC58TH43_TOBAC
MVVVDTSVSSSSSSTYVSDPLNPLHLSSSDVHGISLVSNPFSGTDFGGWRRSMIVSLSTRNKIAFIDGSCPRPVDDSPQIKLWDRCNNMVISWMTSSLSPDIAESGSLDIASYFNKLKKLWDELAFLHSKYANRCNCGGRSEEEEENKLYQFLMGLNDAYVSVRSNLLMMQPLPSLDNAYNILLQDERQRQFTKGKRIARNVEVQNLGVNSDSTNLPSECPPDSGSLVLGLTKEQYTQLLHLLQQNHVSDSPTQYGLMGSANFAGMVPSPACGPSLKRPVEVGKVDHGLYKLLVDGSSTVSTVLTSTCDSDSVSSCKYHSPLFPVSHCTYQSDVNKMEILWHNQLGHMPFSRMKDISVFPCKFSNKQPFVCSICSLARQPRLPFPDSCIKTSSSFQLVHVDTWGPYSSPTYNGCKYFFTIVDDLQELLGLISWVLRAMFFLY